MRTAVHRALAVSVVCTVACASARGAGRPELRSDEGAALAALARRVGLGLDRFVAFPDREAFRSSGADGYVVEGGGVVALRVTHASARGVADLGVLDFPSLGILYLPDDGLTTVPDLRRLPRLAELSVAYNAISRIENLDSAPALRALSLEGNPISRMEGFEGCPALEYLNLSFTNVTAIEGADQLGHLRTLLLWHAALTQVDELPKLHDLAYVGFGENPFGWRAWEGPANASVRESLRGVAVAEY
jgi:hypothetical protein